LTIRGTNSVEAVPSPVSDIDFEKRLSSLVHDILRSNPIVLPSKLPPGRLRYLRVSEWTSAVRPIKRLAGRIAMWSCLVAPAVNSFVLVVPYASKSPTLRGLLVSIQLSIFSNRAEWQGTKRPESFLWFAPFRLLTIREHAIPFDSMLVGV